MFGYLVLLLRLPMILSHVQEMKYEDERCIYMFGAPRLDFKKSSSIMQHVNPESKNITHILNMLELSRKCLIIISSESQALVENFLSIKRHLVLVNKFPCSNIPASSFNSEMYCLEDGEVWEKYRIKDQVVRRRVSDKTLNLKKLSAEKLTRRSNLQGIEMKVTSLDASHRMKNIWRSVQHN